MISKNAAHSSAVALPESRTRFQLYGVQDLLTVPPPIWLVKPLLELAALVVVYGASGGGKSFLALAWALSVAAGRPWLGYQVNQGSVLYIVAEGSGGFPQRVRAWLQRHGLEHVAAAHFILEPVKLLNEDDITLLMVRISQLPQKPALIVLDTYAMCFDGDENSSRDVALAIAAAKQIIRETGATVILVHHTGKKGKEERGHSALRCAADAMMLVEKRGDVITVKNTKQKNDKEFEPIRVRLKRVPLAITDEDGVELTSCVLEPADAAEAQDGLTEPLAETLEPLAASPDSLQSSEWQESISQRLGCPLAPRTFQNRRATLLKNRFIEQVGRKYRITEGGREALSRRRTGVGASAM